MRHLLFLRQATLGVNAIEGERNIVQVTSKDFQVVCFIRLNRAVIYSLLFAVF